MRGVFTDWEPSFKYVVFRNMFVINICIGFNWTLNSLADEYSQRNVFHILKSIMHSLINEERRLDRFVYVV